jgi:hypothetical protein
MFRRQAPSPGDELVTVAYVINHWLDSGMACLARSLIATPALG